MITNNNDSSDELNVTKGSHGLLVLKKKSFFASREAGLLLVILMAGVLLTFFAPSFLQKKNFISVSIGLAYDLIIALGMTLILIVGGIDLSVGSVLALTGVITTLLLNADVSIPLAIILGLGSSALAGLITGLGVTRFNIPPFIASLGMMSIARGTATVLTSGYFVTNLPDSYKMIGRGVFLGIPYPIYATVFLVILFAYILKNWGPLAKTFYIGTNAKAAELSGINAKLITLSSYIICSLMAGIAALFQTARLGMGYAQMGQGAELRAIAAALIGGASLAGGGEGSVVGTFLGVVLLAVILNGFILLNVSIYWQGVVNGLILVIVVAVDAIQRAKISKE
jgi:ribose transport system permease protein